MNHNLKLIQIHKKNIEILNKQKAQLGMHCPMHIQNQLDHENESVAEIETELKRRLNALLLKSAQYGISVDPSVTIEIEDIQSYFDNN